MVCFATFKFGGPCSYYLKFNSQNTGISLKVIHFIDKLKLILISRVRNSTANLTLGSTPHSPLPSSGSKNSKTIPSMVFNGFKIFFEFLPRFSIIYSSPFFENQTSQTHFIKVKGCLKFPLRSHLSLK